jgi:hypothetical protein
MSAVIEETTVVEAPVEVTAVAEVQVQKFGPHSAKLSDAGTCGCKGCYGSRQARLANGPTVKKAKKYSGK